MFDAIFEAIEEWMRTLLTTMVTSNLQTMFTDVNEKTGEIATQVGQTPQGWNGSIFGMIQNLSSTVILPIAGMIITFVLCYELISMLTEKNNMHDIDTWMFFKYFFKMMIAVYLVSNTFNITMAVFDVGQHVVNSAAGVISGNAAIDVTDLLAAMETAMEDMEVGELVVLALETLLVSFTDRYELFAGAFCPGIPGIPDDGMRRHLRRPGRFDPDLRKHACGTFRAGSLYGAALLHTVQDGEPEQTDIQCTLKAAFP